MNTPVLHRSPSELFRPAEVQPLASDVSWRERTRTLRDNPLATIPASLLKQTYLSGPFMGRTVHQVSGPSEVKAVLQDSFMAWRKSPLILRMLTPILGDAILVAHNDSWKRQRMVLQPAFARRKLDRFIPLMVSAANQAADRLGASQRPIDVSEVMNDTTFAVIERALFTDVEGFDRQAVRQAIEALLVEIGNVRYSDLIPFPEWMPRLMSAEGRSARRVFRTAVDAQLKRRRRLDDPEEDLLGLLLAVRSETTGEGLSDIDIRDTLMTFVAAGHETTAIALTWSLYLIANDPVCQAALQQEAEGVIGRGDVQPDQIASLSLTRQVIEEALRLFPPAPVLGRRAIADTEVCGHRVQKGDMALLAFYALQRHETLWDHPAHFDPDRWTRDRRPTDRYMSMAFGGGPRACLGAQFAMTEASIILATILSRLTVEPAHGVVEPVMQVTLRPREGMPLVFTPR